MKYSHRVDVHCIEWHTDTILMAHFIRFFSSQNYQLHALNV
jgi:hypothetical protein